MKLLVFAQTPPPWHGQSAMVATLVEGLRADPAIEILHVNPRLSRDGGEIGRWQLRKLCALLRACAAARRLRGRHGDAVLYYVPAPGKRGALYRDFLVMLLCRGRFSRLVLHWHAVGLGAWLTTTATAPERWLARRLLARADLSLVLAPELSDDAAALVPRKIFVVPNSAPDPGAPPPRAPRDPNAPCEVLFLGLCSEAKGLFDTMDGVAHANGQGRGNFRLTVAGGFASGAEEREFLARATRPGAQVNAAGFLGGEAKEAAFRRADVFCFPTHYPHEGQPVALVEALAHDLPIITTKWRAIPGMLPSEHVWFVERGSPRQIADALQAAARAPRPHGALREHYLNHFTPARHLAALREALLSLER